MQNKELIIDELSMKSVKAVTEEKENMETGSQRTLEKNYQKAAAYAVNKVIQDLATNETEQRLRQETEKHQRGKTLSGERTKPENLR